MDSLTARKFMFVSKALPKDTFEVVSFTGSEGLSRLYRFEITLVSDSAELDLETIIQSRATLTILRDDGNIRFNGILSEFEQLGTILGQTEYRAVLTPAFWRQTLTHHNQIFLDKTIPQIVEAAMKDGGLTSLDYEFKLIGEYPPHEYVCQYNESHHSFISRLMEREGFYYYFEQGVESEKVIITDTALLHSVMEEGERMSYSPPSGLDESAREEVIKAVLCSQKMLPKRVVLKDYNYRKPSLDLTAECVVSERGVGDVFIYGEHFSTPEEGARLAKVRAEALKCRARTFQGESLIPYLRPGYIFQLDGHNRKDFNGSYLTTDITHNGDQAFKLAAGLDQATSTRERSSYYRNTFTAITSDCQFRPERTTDKPRISGTLNAHIDAEGSGQYAEIDEHGRYKVRMPFDLSDARGGKASSWLRMAQPYAGSDHGMHFPLHKDTEVLITFIDGDPDRPIIAAAVPNPLAPSPVTGENCTQNRITTAGGNKIHMEDQAGGERILLHTPRANSWIRMGTPNDPPRLFPPRVVFNEDPPGGNSSTNSDHEEIEKLKAAHEADEEKENRTSEIFGIKFHTGNLWEVEAALENKVIYGESTETIFGAEVSTCIGSRSHISLINMNEITLGVGIELVTEKGIWHVLKHEATATKHETSVESLETVVNLTCVGVTKEEILEEVSRIYATKTDVTGVENKLTDVKSELNGSLQTMEGKVTKLVSDEEKLAGRQVRLIAACSKMATKVNTLVADTSTMASKVTNMSVQVTNMSTQVSNLADSVVDIQETQTAIATTIQML